MITDLDGGVGGVHVGARIRATEAIRLPSAATMLTARWVYSPGEPVQQQGQIGVPQRGVGEQGQ